MIAIVTATLDAKQAEGCINSWITQARRPLSLYIVVQNVKPDVPPRTWEEPDPGNDGSRSFWYGTSEILGVVPAFALGVQKALEDGHEIIACFHDDLEIQDPGWDLWITKLFRDNPQIGLCGFGGGIGLGDPHIYQTPYDPMQLARRGFVSNMRDAAAHGARSLQPVKVACLDGFSQIGRREYWLGKPRPTNAETQHHPGLRPDYNGPPINLFEQMHRWGIIHHAYDAALGCFAKRLGWDTWMIPIICHHYGGRTAVGNQDYTQWANARAEAQGVPDVQGDQLFWIQAHQIVYDQFRDVLPIN